MTTESRAIGSLDPPTAPILKTMKTLLAWQNQLRQWKIESKPFGLTLIMEETKPLREQPFIYGVNISTEDIIMSTIDILDYHAVQGIELLKKVE